MNKKRISILQIKRLLYFLSLLFLSIAMFFTTFIELEEKKQNVYSLLKQEAIKINLQLENSLELIEIFLHYIGKKIIHDNDFSAEHIADLLQNVSKDFLTSSIISGNNLVTVDYTTPGGYIIATNVDGVVEHPVFLDPKRRSWITNAKTAPWKLLLSTVDAGFISNTFIVSTGYGLTDHNEKFIGYLSSGLNLSKLSAILKNIKHPDVNFILFDNQFNFVVSSRQIPGLVNVKISDEIKKVVNDIKLNKKEQINELSSYVNINEKYYTHVAVSNKHDFIFFIGPEKNFRELKFHFYKEILFIALFIIALSALYFWILHITNIPVSKLHKLITNKNPEEQNIHKDSFRIREYDEIAKYFHSHQDVKFKLNMAENKLNDISNFNNEAFNLIHDGLLKSAKQSSMITEKINQLVYKINLDSNNKKGNIKYLNQAKLYLNKGTRYFKSKVHFFSYVKELIARKWHLKEEKVELNNLLTWVYEYLKNDELDKDLITLNLSEKPIYITGDITILKYMLEELLDFVIEKNDDNSKQVNISIEDHISSNGAKEILIIFDCSRNVTTHERNNIYKKFEENYKNTIANKLFWFDNGLIFVKCCILAHDGEMKIKSKPGRGVQIYLTIPEGRIL